MPVPTYLSITGEHQVLVTAGNFTAASVQIYQEGHEDEALMEAFEHQIVRPRDPQSGQPTSQRMHKPPKITKVMDKSSPLMFRVLTSGERLSIVVMKFYRTSVSGTGWANQDGGNNIYTTRKVHNEAEYI